MATASGSTSARTRSRRSWSAGRARRSTSPTARRSRSSGSRGRSRPRPGDRFALRNPSPGSTAGGGVVLDPSPPRGVSRRRLTGERAGVLAKAVGGGDPAVIVSARIELHGALESGGSWSVAPDVETALRDTAAALVTAHHGTDPASPGLPVPTLRAAVALAARRRVTLGRAPSDAVARSVVDNAIADGAPRPRRRPRP